MTTRLPRPFPRPARHRQSSRGVALIIVLAFVALLTGVLVAFLSRSISDRQISNGSANDARTRLFAEGAVDTLISDLKQEIAAGSASPAPTPAAGVTLYFPKVPATAVPALVGTAAGAGTENLLKRSAHDQPFYAGANYDTANFPPPGDPAAAVTTRSRAANASTLAPSLNGRFITPARWNKPLLLAKANPTSDADLTPIGATPPAGAAGATWANAPDWALVTRDGSIPTAWTPNLVAGPNKPKAVVGRYAYQIYDEGGLLDANAVGVPSTAPLSTSPYANLAAYKGSLAFADLRQLPGVKALAVPRQDELLNALVGWRNFASAQPMNNFPGYAFTPAQVATFLPFAANHPKDFLAAGNTTLYNGQSDRLLAGRQELLKFVLNGFASQGATGTGKTERANLQNALAYLTHFSRDLNQPSLAPDPNRPKITGGPATGGNNASGGDDAINPSFLSVRVIAPFVRSDGIPAESGEPLVKKRFSLNRLAWLSYKGPSANNLGDAGVQQAITALGGDPNNAQDPVYRFVARGTDDGSNNTNIPKCFGLTWDLTTKRWKYVHGKNGTSGPIMTLAQVAALDGPSAREPDFFELLKAGINVGSVGKPGTPAVNPANFTAVYQNQRDVSIDVQVMQIGANIIDQFDGDGFPTRIAFDDGSLPQAQEYRGVEDLPYFYRVRGGWFPLKDSSPLSMFHTEPYEPAGSTPNTMPVTKQNGYAHKITDPPFMTDAGLGVAFQEPEIWNPHAWNAASISAGGARPTQFRLVAVSDTPDVAVPSNSLNAQATVRYNSSLAYQYCPVGTAPQHALTLTQDNSALEFGIPNNRLDLFREPTMLIKPGIPSGSQLRFGANHQVFNAAVESAIQPYLKTLPVGLGIQSLYAGAYSAVGAADDQLYLGIYLGSFPVRWKDSTYIYAVNYVTVAGAGANTLTYRLQYQDPGNSSNWLTYDEKFTTICYGSNSNTNTDKGIGNAMTGDGIVRTYLDPRSSRFGIMQNQNGYNQNASTQWMPVGRGLTGSNYGGTSNRAGWAGNATGQYNSTYQYAAEQNALWTCRPDGSSGFSANGPASTLGWVSGSIFRPGVICQNNPSAPNGNNRFNAGGPPYNAGYNGGEPGVSAAQFFADPDGVVRRGMAAYMQPDTASASQPLPALPPDLLPPGAASGNPQSVAYAFASATAAIPGQATPIGGASQTEARSRPIILNRPFRSVAEMGCVYSGTPWRNLDFSTPESGCAALLDVFCIGETDHAKGLVAGRVNLNTRQAPVLQAILANAVKDEFAPTNAFPATGNASAQSIALGLSARTSDTAAALGSGPLRNVSEIVGRFVSKVATGSAGMSDGAQSYAGFSGVPSTSSTPPDNPPNLSAILAKDTTAAGYTTRNVQRFREGAVRALGSVGTTRVWTLMADVVAQTGRYPASAASAANPLAAFLVEGEQRYWVHLAIDRSTGEVLDKQIEPVKE